MEKIELKGIDEVIYYDKCDNGLGIYMWVNEKVNNYYITYNVKYGALHTEFTLDDSKKVYKVPSGVAHFLEHIKFNTKDGGTANDFYNNYGISINAFTTFKFTAYEVYGNSYFKECLEYLLEYVSTPYFTKEMIEKEKPIIVEEARMGKNSPSSKLYFGAYNAVLHHDKHKIVITGEEDEIKSISLKDINLVYDNFYHPENMFVIITGNFNPYEAVAIVKEKMRSLEFPEYKDPQIYKEKEPVKVVKKHETLHGNVEIPKVRIVYKMKRSEFKGYDDVKLRAYLGMLLRANFGASSLLKEELLEKQLVTGLGYFREILDDIVLVGLSVETKYVDEVVKMLMDKMQDLSFDEEMLVRRRRANIATVINEYDDIEYVNSDIQDNLIEYGRIVDELYDVYDKVTVEDILKIRDSIRLDNYSIVELLPE